MAGVSGLQNDWRTFLQRQPIVDRTTASRQARKLDWFYEVRHLSTSLGLVEAGLGISALPRSGNAPCALFFDYWYSTGGTRYTSDIGDYSPQRCRAFSGSRTLFALLINLWTDDKDNLWTNIVERQRHALQEIG